MDQLSLAAAMATTSGMTQALLATGAVGTVLALEVPWRCAGVRVGDIGVKQCAKSCAAVLCRCAPELMGLSVVLFLAALLRMRGDVEDQFSNNPAEKQVWEQIKKEWPILMGADTLLNLQAMIRLLVLLFVSIRAQASGRSPLGGMPALLLLAAAMTRGMLNTQTGMYRLEGPLALGGDLPAFCELAGIPFLAALGMSELRKAPVKAAAVVSGAIWFASHHFLNMAQDASIDRLFLQAHVLELVASFFYVARTFCVMMGRESETVDDTQGRQLVEKRDFGNNAFVGLMHMLLTMQQAFSAYYFLTAFEPHPSLVGGGRPFCVLCIGNLLQLGAYLGAAGLFVGGCVDLESPSELIEPVTDEPGSTAAVEDEQEEEEEAAMEELEEDDVDVMAAMEELDEDLKYDL